MYDWQLKKRPSVERMHNQLTFLVAALYAFLFYEIVQSIASIWSKPLQQHQINSKNRVFYGGNQKRKQLRRKAKRSNHRVLRRSFVQTRINCRWQVILNLVTKIPGVRRSKYYNCTFRRVLAVKSRVQDGLCIWYVCEQVTDLAPEKKPVHWLNTVQYQLKLDWSAQRAKLKRWIEKVTEIIFWDIKMNWLSFRLQLTKRFWHLSAQNIYLYFKKTLLLNTTLKYELN